MSSVRTIQIRDWDRFKESIVRELFGEEPFRLGTFLFRGQANGDWPLESSFDRSFATVNEDERSKVFERLLSYFREECDRVFDGVGSDADQLVALAQHHGLPTRLLDWSESPYIAAFFAYASAASFSKGSTHVAVWVLDRELVDSGKVPGLRVIRPRVPENRRMQNQFGCFTALESAESAVEDVVARSDVAILRRILLPISESNRALADLSAMGISFSQLFPDLDGASRAATLRLSLELGMNQGR